MRFQRGAIAVSGLCATLLLGACAGTASAPEQQVSEAPVSLTVSDSWRGVLPCLDCQGLDTRLTLLRSGVTGLPAGYVIDQKRLDATSQAPATSRTGDWTIEKGSLTDPSATIFRLEPDMPSASCMAFQLLDRGALRQLDCRGAPLNVSREPILQPVQPPSASAAARDTAGSSQAAAKKATP
ncbi:NlpE-like protein [Kushneria sinocarnis]|uniref:NlpE-like protein n=1 Tax=Kushneria sinocarnis TaxID=595502 RepID=A0A420WXH7_9GAMM|nr:copper resistance protein NlpE N-terminal domain-containing protein [Kushneria sinocarnis]RKR04372.1 NlpE-like protein [Kushneria sinocarnis]